MRLFSRARLFYGIFAVLILGTVTYFVAKGSTDDSLYELTRVERGDLINQVFVTGRIEPKLRVNLAFATGGSLRDVPVAEGEEVKRGDVVAQLDTAVLQAQLSEASASIAVEEAKLAELLEGTRSEEVAITAATLEKSTVERDRAQIELAGVIERSYQLARNSVETNIDSLFEKASTDPNFDVKVFTGSATYAFKGTREQTLAIERSRSELNEHFAQWLADVAQNPSTLIANANKSEGNLLHIVDLAGKLSAILNAQNAIDSSQQNLLDAYKASVSSTRTTVSSLLSELRTARDAYESRVASVEVAKRELEFKSADPTVHALSAQYAAIEKMVSAKNRIQAQITDAKLLAPVDGVVVNLFAEEGEVVAGGATVAVVISKDEFELVAFIPEADIARVSVDDNADVLLDAYDRSEVLLAKVQAIAQIETNLEGVAAYETTFTFEDSRATQIRSGMTADISILTDERNDVLFIPLRAVVRSNGRQYVRVIENGKLIERDVEVGLRSSNGMVEIQSGLFEHEAVVLFIENE